MLRIAFFVGLLTFSSAAIRKAKTDELEYKIYTTTEGLKVALIEDKEATSCSAAIRVEVGSLEDPKDYAGLAHFTEHMMFLGSSKYPGSSELREAVKAGSGRTNAFTELDATTYFFEVNSEEFAKVIDIFASALRDPLFRPEDARKEVKAVNSEHLKNLKQDTWKIYQLTRLMGNPNTSIRKFTTGNLETLDKPEIAAKIRLFFKEHYLPSRIKLAMYCKDIASMEEIVSSSFENIRNQDQNLPPISYENAEFFRQKDLAKLVEFERRGSFPKILVRYILPYRFEKMDFKPLEIIIFVLGHEGPGSILRELMNRKLATALNASYSNFGKGQSMLTVAINLTESGFSNYKTVLAMVSKQVENMKTSFDLEIFEDLKQNYLINFEYKNKNSPANITQSLVSTLGNFPDDQVLFAPFDYSNFDREKFIECLEFIKLKNALVLLSSSHPLKSGKLEPIYSTRYIVSEITSSEQYTIEMTGRQFVEIKLPPKNAFISSFEQTEKSLLLGLPLQKSASPPVPRNILPENESKKGKLFYLLDREYSQPIIQATFKIFLNKKLLGNPVTSNTIMMWVEMQANSLLDLTYQAEFATISTSVAKESYGISIEIGALAPSLSPYLTEFAGRLEKFIKECPSKELFDHEFYSLENTFDDFVKKDLFRFGIDSAGWVFQEFLYSPEVLFPALKKVTYESFCHYHRSMFSETYIEALITGKLKEEEAISIFRTMAGVVQKRPLDINDRIQGHLYLPSRKTKVITKVPDIQIGNNFLMRVQVLDSGKKTTAFNVILENFVSNDFYDELRTKKGVGYVVFLNGANYRGTQVVQFGVQTEDFTSEEASKIVDEYVRNLVRKIEKIDAEEFEKIRKIGIHAISEPFLSPQELHTYLLENLKRNNLDFDSKPKLLSNLRSIELEEFKKMFDDFFVKNSKFVEIHLSRIADTRKTFKQIEESALDFEVFTSAEQYKGRVVGVTDEWN